MADEPREVFSWETVVALAHNFNDITAEQTELLGFPPFMHALTLMLCAHAAEETFRRGITEDDWVDYQATRDKFLTHQREAFEKARAERAKSGG